MRDDPATSVDDAALAAAAAELQEFEAVLRDPARLKAVVDANAVFKGVVPSDPSVTCVTIEEVLGEIRDAATRGRAETFRLRARAPSEEAVEAVKRFAVKTGDIHALSKVDLKLIALAYDLERVCHGVEHLRTEPAPPRMTGKKANANEKRPGWDFVPNADDWAELDEMNNAQEEAEREMRAKMASVALSDAEAEKKTVAKESAAERERREDEEAKARARAAQAAETARGQTHIEKNDDEDAGWERAVSRTTRVRRQKREERARLAAEAKPTVEEKALDENADDRTVELEEASKRAVDFFTSRGEIEEGAEEEEEGDDASGPDDDYDEIELESCVSSVTADFAMQNVILQMGLKLVAPDGMRIEQLRRWVLRCHACNEITRDLTRIFCPKCGNQTLQKVEHTVTRDGVEQFGVRKKFVLRGSKYSLPAPKGGRREKKLILREDQLMSVRLTKKQVGEDVFAAEYNEESYADIPRFASQKTAYEIGGGNVRRNPNERRHVATNRRRK